MLRAVGLVLLGSCTATQRVEPPPVAGPPDMVLSPPLPAVPARPPLRELGKWDWLQLGSGEWLKGEVASLEGETLEFESDELGDLELDWDDVAELVTEQPYTLRLADRSTVVGVPAVDRERVVVRSPEGTRVLRRADVIGFIRGKPTEGNYWSGRVRLGLSVREGNTDQTDSTVAVDVTRRTAASRLALSLDSVVGTLDGRENVNTQSLQGRFDLFLTRRFFLTPLGFELFRDRIQNIDLRAAPFSGLGYTLVDGKDVEWDVSAGVGYRYTRFDSVAAGEDDTDETLNLVFGTDYAHELAKDVDLELAYDVQVGLEDADDTNQDASVLLTFELLWDLDFSVRFVWKRVGQPERDADGAIPEKDDLRLDVGLSWEF